MELEQEISRLEAGIRRLKVEYDMFLAGGSRLPPLALQRELQLAVKQLSNRPLLRTAERFQVNTLVGRFNSLNELLGKQLRSREEGRNLAGAPLPESRERTPSSRPGPLRVVVGDPAAEAPALQRLYDRWMDARREAGENPRLTLDSFVRQIAKQVANLQSSRGCSSVEFQVDTAGGQVSLKARPVDAVTIARENRR